MSKWAPKKLINFGVKFREAEQHNRNSKWINNMKKELDLENKPCKEHTPVLAQSNTEENTKILKHQARMPYKNSRPSTTDWFSNLFDTYVI